MLDLEAIELIKQLKARYFRALDICDTGLLESVFTDDAQIDFYSPAYEIHLNGWAEAEPFYRTAFSENNFGMHHGHTPEIDVTGDTATGLWYMSDFVVNLKHSFFLTGSAIYEDTYVKHNGQWRISKTGYHRRLEVREPVGDREIISSPFTRTGL